MHLKLYILSVCTLKGEKMKKILKAILMAALCALVCFAVTSCKSKYADYTITVIDEIGNPMSNVMVKFTDANGESKTRITDKEGKAIFPEALVGENTVKLEKGFSDATIITSEYSLDKKTTSLRAVVVDETKIQSIYGDVADDAYAYNVGAGTYNIPGTAGKTTYLVFNAIKDGIYKVSFTSDDSDMTVGYYGIPMFVQSSHRGEGAYDGKTFEIVIHDTGTPYVIGLNCVSGLDAALTIERVGDAPFDPQFADPEIVKATENFKYYTPFVLNTMTDSNRDVYDISIVSLTTPGIGFEGTYIATIKNGTATKDVVVTEKKITVSSGTNSVEYRYKIENGVPVVIDNNDEKIEDLKFTVKTDATVTDLDLADENLSVTVNNGYYYTADGKQIYVHINSASKYFPVTLALLAGITDNNVGIGIGGDVYDENGNFVAKYSYNNMIIEYYQYIDANGLYPLTVELADAIKNHGNYVGWWDKTNPNFILGEFEFVQENAWLFLGCTVE